MSDRAGGADERGRDGLPPSLTFRLDVDPATIGTAQQKRFDPRSKRFFTDRRVARGMRVMSALAKSALSRAGRGAVPRDGETVSLRLDLWYGVPKSRRRELVEGGACSAMWAGDCDNRAKSIIDSLTAAGFWPDDRYVSRLEVTKRWTHRAPGIVVTVGHDGGDSNGV